MIAVDTNILVYAHRRDVRDHVAAASAMARLAEGVDSWAIPWHCIHEFLAVVTNPRAFGEPVASALAQANEWLNSPSITLLSEGPGYATVLTDVLLEANALGGRVHDARIAALCLYHGVTELWTADRDFGRFPRLRTRNPLAA